MRRTAKLFGMALFAGGFGAAVPASAREVPATDVTASGLHASLTRVRGGDKNGEVGAVGIATSHVGFGFEQGVAVRVVNTGSIAGGPDGVQGGLGNAVAGGVRLPFDTTHGLVLRGGIEASFFGNKVLWDSLLELPQLHVGYQWLVPHAVIDVAARGGYVLLGRFNTGDGASRRLDGAPEVGGIASYHLGAIDLRASYARVFARHGGEPVDLLEGALCGHGGVVVMCTDLRYEVGDVRMPADRAWSEARASYVGLTLGISLSAKKH
jgi:hypothetical protein